MVAARRLMRLTHRSNAAFCATSASRWAADHVGQRPLLRTICDRRILMCDVPGQQSLIEPHNHADEGRSMQYAADGRSGPTPAVAAPAPALAMMDRNQIDHG